MTTTRTCAVCGRTLHEGEYGYSARTTKNYWCMSLKKCRARALRRDKKEASRLKKLAEAACVPDIRVLALSDGRVLALSDGRVVYDDRVYDGRPW